LTQEAADAGLPLSDGGFFQAAAESLMRTLSGRPPIVRFKAEICLVDRLDRGILVYRDEKRALILPSCRLFHWAKRFFAWQYLRPYRKVGQT
jgi:sulfide:quinone oxidoreductase